jgi:hypothetical protein
MGQHDSAGRRPDGLTSALGQKATSRFAARASAKGRERTPVPIITPQPALARPSVTPALKLPPCRLLARGRKYGHIAAKLDKTKVHEFGEMVFVNQ